MYDEGDFAPPQYLANSHFPKRGLMSTETFLDGTIVIGSWLRMVESVHFCNLVSEKVIAYLLSLC